jgi:hypothetical protein
MGIGNAHRGSVNTAFNLVSLVTKSTATPLPWYYDFGWPSLLVLLAGIFVFITGIRAIIKANHLEQFRHGMLLHGLSLLAAVTLGLFGHLICEWYALGFIASSDSRDHSLEALDRMLIAKQDMLSCGVIFLGTLLGGIATLRMAGHLGPRPPIEAAPGQPDTRSESNDS